jgi:hypothetical protein
MAGEADSIAVAEEMAGRFAAGDRVGEIEVFRRGHIHSSFRVAIGEAADQRRILLQRVNDRVFVDPDAVDRNIRSITDHLRRAVRRHGGGAERRVLELLVGDGGETLVQDREGGWWRAYRFVENAVPADEVNERIVERAARAYGDFQRLLIDYDGPALSETIPGFHDTPRRLDALETAVHEDPHGRLARVRTEVDDILGRRHLGSTFVTDHDLPVRIVHNDAKLDNVLFDPATGEGLCVVDLDTVMPGFVGYDFGDMVRSMSVTGSEDGVDSEVGGVRDRLFGAVARGYLDAMGGVLTASEIATLVPSGVVLTLEQAARFLTDHLLGDTYYRIERPDQNLQRARAQLAILESLLEAGPRLEVIVERELLNVER